jgi:hypothetical protein
MIYALHPRAEDYILKQTKMGALTPIPYAGSYAEEKGRWSFIWKTT